jgi:hypothetical protein
MSRLPSRIKPVLAAICALHALVPLSFGALAQDIGELAGTWTLVSSVTEKGGEKTEQFGPGAKGMMSLDADGHFMLTIVGADLPRFASNNRATGTAEENQAVVRKSIAMIGTYSINLADKTLIFKVDSSTFPNWNGTTQKRSIIAASKEQLKYITATASSGGIGTVTWKRPK